MIDDKSDTSQMYHRQIVVDIKTNRNSNKKHNNFFEFQSIIKAAQEYGKKTHRKGLLRGITAVELIINRLQNLQYKTQEIDDIITDAQKCVFELKNLK